MVALVRTVGGVLPALRGTPPQVMDFFKLPTNAAIVLVDEVALDFGQLRLKAKGGAGGHNGLKSLQSHLKTQEYTRLRIGVGGEDANAC